MGTQLKGSFNTLLCNLKYINHSAEGASARGLLMVLNHEEWLKHQCSKLMYGKCSILGCLKRGGYHPLEALTPMGINYEQATCIPYEIYKKLEP